MLYCTYKKELEIRAKRIAETHIRNLDPRKTEKYVRDHWKDHLSDAEYQLRTENGN